MQATPRRSRQSGVGGGVRVVAIAAGVAGILALLVRDESAVASNTPFIVFSKAQRECAIVVPADALPQEYEAAELLGETLSAASGIPKTNFPIRAERAAVPPHALFVGATRRGQAGGALRRKAPFDTSVSLTVDRGSAFLQSEKRESIVAAASWFLENYVGAHWFMPGPLGHSVPPRPEVILAVGRRDGHPGFISRDLGTGSSRDEQRWYARNRLEARFDHGHNLVNIFKVEDLRGKPEMAPMRNGARYMPGTPGDYHWQPNMLSEAAVEHAAGAANRAFEADPKRTDFSLSVNDSIRFDESPETLAAVSPPRFFRKRPDYSNLVFRFTNAVAEKVIRRHPDRWLPAYAYYWCENTPDFPVAPTVVPFLTADRTQWSHPEFAQEDRALIERWCRSGAKIVGVYDYFEGSPFLVPRPTLYVPKETIPFEYRAGVRAFYGEGAPNWALDGPKHWLAAQLLWSPQKNPDELLETYYREFWAEAAGPMREFHALCDRTWRELPGPPQWLRYYDEEDHFLIYSPARLAELRRCVAEAAQLAQSPVVRARVAFVSAGLGVTEAFCDFCSARREFSQRAHPGAGAADLVQAWQRYRARRARFVATLDELQREQPLAVRMPMSLDTYLRNEPDSRAARELMGTEEGRAALRSSPYLPWSYIGASPEQIAAVLARGAECLQDADWSQLRTRPVGRSVDYEWTEPGQWWRGNGDPWEGRRVELQARGGRRVLRLAGAHAEQLGQWTAAVPDSIYAAQVKVRAKVSMGTAIYVVLSFLDENQRYIGMGRVDRVPLGEGVQELTLCVIAPAPANARFVGFGLRVWNQLDDEFAEFSDASLRRVAK